MTNWETVHYGVGKYACGDVNVHTSCVWALQHAGLGDMHENGVRLLLTGDGVRVFYAHAPASSFSLSVLQPVRRSDSQMAMVVFNESSVVLPNKTTILCSRFPENDTNSVKALCSVHKLISIQEKSVSHFSGEVTRRMTLASDIFSNFPVLSTPWGMSS